MEAKYSKQKDTQAGMRWDAQTSDKIRSFSALQLLVATVLWIAATPFIDTLEHGDLVASVLLTLLLLSAVLVFGNNLRKLVLAVILVAPAFGGKWVNHFRPGSIPEPVFLATELVFVSFVVVNLFRFILTAPRVDREVLCAAVTNYLMMGILWTFAYLFVASLVPDAFAFTHGPVSTQVMDSNNALYFSFVTLSTIGFGDITPISKYARMLAIAESSSGIIYVAVVIARLVALYTAESGHK